MIWFRRDFKIISFQPPVMGRATFHYTRLPKATFNLISDTFRTSQLLWASFPRKLSEKGFAYQTTVLPSYRFLQAEAETIAELFQLKAKGRRHQAPTGSRQMAAPP